MSNRLFRWLALTVLMIAFAPLCHATDTSAVEREIMRLENVWNDAYGANDLPNYFGYYAQDALLVFYNERTTVPEYRKFWTQATKTEPVQSAKISDIKIRVGPSGDTAVASYQIDVRTRHGDGKVTEEHAFETDVWSKRGSEWRISVVHYSGANSPPK
jgi:ketosteroid isomerase-like protein